MKQINVIHKTLEDGSKIVLVPLTKRKRGSNGSLDTIDTSTTDYVTFDEEGFEELLSLGIHPVFKVKQKTVWCRSKSKVRYSKSDNVAVARVLCDLDQGQCIRYLDGDCKNLRYRNLIVADGMSIYKARDQITKQFPARRYELIHNYEQ